MKLSMNKIRSLVENFKLQIYNQGYKIDEAWIFGSQVKASSHYNDLDILFISKEIKKLSRTERIEKITSRLNRDNETPVDIFLWSPEEFNNPKNLLADTIKRTGKKI